MSFKNSKSFTRRSDACQFPIGNNQKCGETQTLDIIKEFRQLYENKMKLIDTDGCGDCLTSLQAKLELQHEWIKDLTEQNEMLVRTVEELENEATERVIMLEQKLHNSAKNGNEVMQKYRDFSFSINLDETFQNLVYLKSDLRNLLEFIRRVREEDNWNTSGLTFYNVKSEDLLGSLSNKKEGKENSSNKYKVNLNDEKEVAKVAQGLRKKSSEAEELKRLSQEIKEKDEEIKELKRVILDQKAKDDNQVEQLRRISEDKDNEDDSTMRVSELLRQKNDEIEELKRSMLDMRNALTIEVAEKHDIILNLRRDMQQLEEQCRQSNKQTQFKDDIIKELRKEIKSLKGQKGAEVAEECANCKARVEELQQESDALKKTLFTTKTRLEELEGKSDAVENERDQYKIKHRESMELADKMGMHLASEKENFAIMQQRYEDTISALTQKCEEYESVVRDCGISFEECKHRLQNYEALQNELDTVRKEHRNSLDQVIALNAENRSQNEKISQLQETLNQKECLEVVNKSSTETMTDSSSSILKEDGAPDCQCRIAELENMLEKVQREREIERAKRNQELLNLKQTILELEKALRNSQIRSESLQKAVNLYQNSVNVLEASEERSKIEISQQRQTILNLQEALVASKHQLEESQQKSLSEVSLSWASRWLGGSSSSTPKPTNDNKSVHDI